MEHPIEMEVNRSVWRKLVCTLQISETSRVPQNCQTLSSIGVCPNHKHLKALRSQETRPSATATHSTVHDHRDPSARFCASFFNEILPSFIIFILFPTQCYQCSCPKGLLSSQPLKGMVVFQPSSIHGLLSLTLVRSSLCNLGTNQLCNNWTA